jgi:tetratricopeptide (TPR) repeat protein
MKHILKTFIIFTVLLVYSAAAQAPKQDQSSESIALNAQAEKLYMAGQYDQSMVLLLKALRIREKILGSEHPAIAQLLNNIALVYRKTGNYDQSIAFSERALKIDEKVYGVDSNITIDFRTNLGVSYLKSGNYSKALSICKKNLEVIEKKSASEKSKLKPDIFSNMGLIYLNTGNYNSALSLFEKALKKQGNEDPQVATTLNNIAVTYYEMGNNSMALPLLEKALLIRQKTLGGLHSDIAQSLNNIAQIYSQIGDFGKALDFERRAIVIDEKIFGTENANTAIDINNLGNIYYSSGDYTNALGFFEKALAINEKSLTPDNPNIANSLNSIAWCNMYTDNYSMAKSLFERSLSIQKNSLGVENPTTLNTELSLAKSLYLTDKESSLITDHLSNYYNGILKQLNIVLAMDEASRLSWQYKNLNYELVSMLPEKQIAEIILRTKGGVLESILEDQSIIKDIGKNSSTYVDLQTCRYRIGKIAFSNNKNDQDEVVLLNKRINSILKSVANNRLHSGASRYSLSINPQSIASMLPKGGVLVDFIRSKIKEDSQRQYGALVIPRDGSIKFIKIDDADGIDSIIHDYRSAITKGDEKSLLNKQGILMEKFWTPLSKALPDGTTRLFVGGDGQLNFLSLAALQTPDGAFLGEHYEIAYVGSGRDLARKASPSDSKSIALFADPVFDRQATSFGTNALVMRSGEVDAFARIVLPPLPGTKAEEAAVEEVAKAGGWSPEAHLGEKAAKPDLLALKSPGILHLATHGFYLNSLPENGAEGERGMKVIEAPDFSGNKPAPPPKIDPMHASGIALTGAQATLKAWSDGRVPDPKEDGILTAEEVSGLNLDATWLVTLSACETGIGEVKTGEGVFGLRRAFMIAGAQNLLMTLWPVSDEVTPKIMADFYKEALATHDAAGSLAKVQRDWLVKLRKEKGVLAAVRDAGPFAMVVMANPNLGKTSPVAQPPAEPSSSPSEATPEAPTPPTASPSPSPTPVHATNERPQFKKAA